MRDKCICVYIPHNGISFNYIKKNEILSFATTWVDLDSITLSKISQRERHILYDFICMWNLKNKTNEQPETESQI